MRIPLEPIGFHAASARQMGVASGGLDVGATASHSPNFADDKAICWSRNAGAMAKLPCSGHHDNPFGSCAVSGQKVSVLLCQNLVTD